MMDAATDRSLATEFRFALDVMEERSHLGLDDEYASFLRTILLRRVAQAENAASSIPLAPIRMLVPEEISA